MPTPSRLDPPAEPAGLYIVATPIGNLGDLSPRAARILAQAGLIAAEDTRVTARLLAHIGVKVPMQPYHDHNADAVRPMLLERMRNEVVALVSDAGTPLISDPGYKLVRDARAAGVTVVTVPGPCAAVAALTLAGLPTDRFLFAGFLPVKSGARDAAIDELSVVRATLVFYESAGRTAATLAALHARLGARPAAVAREITKKFEETVDGDLASLAVRYAGTPPRGEVVIVVGPAARDAGGKRRDARCGAGASDARPSAEGGGGGRRGGARPAAQGGLRACAGASRWPLEPPSRGLRRTAGGDVPKRSPLGGCGCRAIASSRSASVRRSARSTWSPGAAPYWRLSRSSRATVSTLASRPCILLR